MDRIIEFDDLDDAMKFVRMLKCEGVKVGGVYISSRKEFNIWKKGMKKGKKVNSK